MIKSFRGKMTHEDQVTIRLGTIRGEIGYMIKKFQLISENPRALAAECIAKIFTVEQTAVTGTVDFDDSRLLAVSYFSNSDNPAYIADNIVIFDNVKVNQDIYVTMFSAHDDPNCNYYIELEQVKLSLDEATVATLKDMRGSS